MNESADNSLKKYFRAIEDTVLCPGREKTAFINDLKAEVGDYLCNSPDADMEEIISVFGSPEEIAQGFNRELSSGEIKKRLSIKRIIIFAVIAVLVIWAVFAAVSFIDVHTEAHGYFTEGILSVINTAGGNVI